ncbi:molybdate ABC transporter substrate-binding protein [Campylobacter lari]|uniref:molybdate ABC transporter substrate-binding protein n=1 Tax=Campylobacter lari TaxID=201 RepID=UPI000873CACB|nr:molybdate ABC transporter substrate-binding protein [Campylobacter lari]EAH4935207.1 molybdate ABC transporter substrate-binding protein [Campylobacter lari]EAH7837424.1 molybdate ABC transporter substrate-binding protein [Campylobacter lari]EAI0924572.1 molybdate ABC transporter substrate-binding protein [Campylobacter lari]EAI2082444.1 molybdate ABC transporter substrate-binding protein [Campylobacter lari]EAI2315284.1 molybdate ABC transporter substrate-binding protein [Campylobacter lar
MKKIFTLLFLCIFGYSADVNIAAAANVAYAFKALQKEFQKENPDISVNVSLGASGNLVSQIKNGAPFDIFMAANMKFAQSLYDDNFASTKPVIYAQGALALLSVRMDLSKGLDMLKEEKVKIITIANPKAAPYGQASIETLQNAKIYEQTKAKIIEAKSIGEALTQTLKAADVGFIAASALYEDTLKSYKLQEGKNYILIDPKLYEPINQGIIITSYGKDNAKAKKFYDFILSKKAKEIFKAYGYNIP